MSAQVERRSYDRGVKVISLADAIEEIQDSEEYHGRTAESIERGLLAGAVYDCNWMSYRVAPVPPET